LRPDRREVAAFFGALSLFFATIEYLFPRPVPFLRLGLSNLPVLLALDLLPVRYLALVTAVKVFGQGLLNGTFASYVFVFSLAGSAAGTAAMVLAHRAGGKRISLVGVSLLGSLASNTVQVALSIALIFGSNATVIAPLFLGVGTLTGLAMGLFARTFAHRSRWYRGIRASLAA
jgi:heptaprenyl diphosphate synthase